MPVFVKRTAQKRPPSVREPFLTRPIPMFSSPRHGRPGEEKKGCGGYRPLALIEV